MAHEMAERGFKEGAGYVMRDMSETKGKTSWGRRDKSVKGRKEGQWESCVCIECAHCFL